MALRLYATPANPRALKNMVAAQLAGVQVQQVDVTHETLKTPEFLQRNPLGKVPVLETPEGYVSESNTILRYIARQNKESGLYGKNQYQEAKVDQWLDFAATELEPHLITLVIPVLGYYPLEATQGQKAHTDLAFLLRVVDDVLKGNNYLVGEQVTIADINLATLVTVLFRFIFGEEQRKAYPNLVRWFNLVTDLPAFRENFGRPRICTVPFSALQFVQQLQPAQQQQQQQGKKGQQQQQPKKQKEESKEQKPKPAKAEEDEEDQPKKAVNPLDQLPPSKFNIDDWKRQFLASKDMKAEFEWFWQNFDAEGWSLWEILYDKAEGEGKMLLKTNNTAKGYLQRIDPHFKKFVFAIHGVYGEEPELEIRGAWLWRGTEIPFEIKDHPSFEFHKHNRLDVTNPEHRALFESYWLNQTEDESVVKGLRVRVISYFR